MVCFPSSCPRHFPPGLFSFLLLLFHLLNIAVHVTESVSKDSWIESFHLFVRYVDATNVAFAKVRLQRLTGPWHAISGKTEEEIERGGGGEGGRGRAMAKVLLCQV